MQCSTCFCSSRVVTVFGPADPKIDQTQFPTEHWSTTPCSLCKEDIPFNAPAPRGTDFTMRASVDSDHAGESFASLSRNGFIPFLKKFLSLFIQRNRWSVRHQVLVRSLL